MAYNILDPSLMSQAERAEKGSVLMALRLVCQRRLAHWRIRPFHEALCLSVSLLCFGGCEKKEAAPPPSPPSVKVVDVIQQDVPVYMEWVAQLNGDTNAEIVPKVQGYLLKQNYKEGFLVAKGQLLFEIDARPFEAALDQAMAQVAVAKAGLSKAETDRARDTPLAAQSAIPQKQLDNDIAAEAAAKAQVDAANAMLEQAKLNLEWTKVYSPIDGVAGVATAQVGDLVGPTTKMTTVSKVNPIRAYFSISENAYLQSAARISSVIGGTAKGGALPVEYIQANEVPYPSMGRIILVNREVSSQTGTIQFAAEFPNSQTILRPGGFGRVRIKTGENKGALLIPQAAVIEVQSAYQVVVVGPDNKVSFRPVQVGERVGNNWVITEGLKMGEKVVAEGFQRVRDGMTVNTEPFVQKSIAEGR
ncbi:MAG: efflux RND transporter periplasmic adaptor subunit [Terracidiphilus sp.]